MKNETWDTYLLAVEPFYYVLENDIIKQLNQKQMSTIRLIFHHLTVKVLFRSLNKGLTL